MLQRIDRFRRLSTGRLPRRVPWLRPAGVRRSRRFLAAVFATLFLHAVPYGSLPCQMLLADLVPDSYLTREVMHYTFDPDKEDKNFDMFPDQWIRIIGPDYPPYVHTLIATDVYHSGGGSLVFELNGEKIAVESVPVPVSMDQSYNVTGFVNSRGLKHSGISMYCLWLDHAGRTLARHALRPSPGDLSWEALSLTIEDLPEGAASLMLRFEVSDEDMTGKVWFDDFRIVQWHKIHLDTERPANIFYDDESVQFSMDLTALPKDAYDIQLNVVDASGDVIASRKDTLDADSEKRTVTLELAMDRLGFFQAQGSVYRQNELFVKRTRNFGIVKRRGRLDTRESFLGVDAGVQEKNLSMVGPLIGLADARWVRTDLWEPGLQDASLAKRRDVVALFLRNMRDRHVKVVAMFGDYPASIYRKQFPTDRDLDWLLQDMSSEAWRTNLTSFLEAFGDQVSWWQLGSDKHDGLALDTAQAGRIPGLKRFLDGPTFQASLGVPIAAGKIKGDASDLDFASLKIEGPYPDDFLVAATSDVRAHIPDASLWLNASDSLGDMDRGDPGLLRRMTLNVIQALKSDFHRVFIPLAGEQATALFTHDWTVTPLFFAWRVLDYHLRGKEYRGVLDLGAGVGNVIFSDGGEAVVIVWKQNDAAAPKEIFLGPEAVETDLMGNERPFGGKRTLVAGDEPRLYSRIPWAILALRMSFQIGDSIVPEIRMQTLHYSLENTFAVPLEGKAVFLFPAGWKVDPLFASFHVEAGATHQGVFRVLPPSNLGGDSVAVMTRLTLKLKQQYDIRIQRDIPIDAELRMKAVVSRDLDAYYRIEVEIMFHSHHPGERTKLIVSAITKEDKPIQKIIPELRDGEKSRKQFLIPKEKLQPGASVLLRAQEVDGTRFANYTLIME